MRKETMKIIALMLLTCFLFACAAKYKTDNIKKNAQKAFDDLEKEETMHSR